MGRRRRGGPRARSTEVLRVRRRRSPNRRSPRHRGEPARRRCPRRRVVDARSRRRVVRRSSRGRSRVRQPRCQRHRRRGVDGRRRRAERRRPRARLVGDVAFLHDTNGLLGRRVTRQLDLTVVVVDNDGGGIFSFLPQASALPHSRSVRTALRHSARTRRGRGRRGARCQSAIASTTSRACPPPLEKCTGRRGVDVIAVATNRAANVAVHDAIHDATDGRRGGRVGLTADQNELRPDDGAEQGLQLGAGLGQLGLDIGARQYADTGEEPRRSRRRTRPSGCRRPRRRCRRRRPIRPDRRSGPGRGARSGRSGRGRP